MAMKSANPESPPSFHSPTTGARQSIRCCDSQVKVWLIFLAAVVYGTVLATACESFEDVSLWGLVPKSQGMEQSIHTLQG